MAAVFVIFVFGAVILGAGAMLSPAWPTPQPRVGLAATFALAIIVGGTIFNASLFGWDTLLIDYLLFTLVVGIFLGGTLSIGQQRAEKRGLTLADADQGWPGPQDLAFFVLVGLVLIIPLLVPPVPYGDAATRYGFLTLTTREGGTFNTLAPFHPEIEYLYAPGFSALTAYLSGQLNQSIATVQFAVSAVLSLLCVWTTYDLGGEIRDKRLGRAMALAILFSLGLFGAHINGHYTALLGLLFAIAFFTYALRYTHYRYPLDAIAAGLMLGAVAISNPGMTVIVGLGYVPWLATIWLGEPRPARNVWLVLAFGIPLIAAIAIAPWLADVVHLLRAGIESPYHRTADNLLVMIQYHGVWIIGAVLLGVWLGWIRRDPVAILAVGWLLLIADFSTTGGLAALFPFITRYADPRDLAWHGPIIPYSILGGMGLLWLWDTYVVQRVGTVLYQYFYWLAGTATVLLLIAALVVSSIGESDAPTSADRDVYAWIRQNIAAEGTRILNFPVSRASLWLPAFAERDSVYYPPIPYLRPAADAEWTATQAELLAFWNDPTNPANEALLRAAGVTHVMVLDNLEEITAENPLPGLDAVPQSDVSNAAYLELLYESDGAQVYAVVGD